MSTETPQTEPLPSKDDLLKAWQQIVGDAPPPPPTAAATPAPVTIDDAKRVVEEATSHTRTANAPSLPSNIVARREVLPLNSGSKRVRPGETIQITARPQRSAFRPERFYVSSHAPAEAFEPFAVAPMPKRPWWKFWARRPDPQVHQLSLAIASLQYELGAIRKGAIYHGGAADWEINDITIGNKSQLAQAGSLPGDMFASTSIDSFISFDTALTAMDVVVTATYRGPIKEGAFFSAAMIGTSAVFEYQH
jgi:hypothetical protein